MTLSRDAMSSLVAEGTSYIALRASLVAGPDINSLLLARCDACFAANPLAPDTAPGSRDVTLARRDTTWTITTGTTAATPASTAHASLAAALVRLASETPADRVLTSPPRSETGEAPATSLARITLRSIAGAPLDVLAIGTLPSAGTDAQGKPVPALIIRTGAIYRVYLSEDARRLLPALAELLPIEG
jgi:hypothetical protein